VPTCIEWRLKLLAALPAALQNQLEALQMDANLQESIVNCIYNTMLDQGTNINGPFLKALEAQSHIGWLAIMLQGHWSEEWQQAYKESNQAPEEETQKQRNK
jgi:hypothetical protein